MTIAHDDTCKIKYLFHVLVENESLLSCIYYYTIYFLLHLGPLKG